MRLSIPTPDGAPADLHTIVYVSAATSPLGVADLQTILTQSSDYNRANAVTGVLLYDKGSFMQCIEGPSQGMDLVYARIIASRKHKGLFELVNQAVPTRSFVDWQIGFAQPTGSELLELATADWQRGLPPPGSLSPESPGFRLLKDFWLRADHSSMSVARQVRSPRAQDGR